jgi:hypothetical protein
MRHLLHKAILFYVQRICGGGFHCNKYGSGGRYVESMSDAEYSLRRSAIKSVPDFALINELQNRCNRRLSLPVVSTDDERLRDILSEAGTITDRRLSAIHK